MLKHLRHQSFQKWQQAEVKIIRFLAQYPLQQVPIQSSPPQPIGKRHSIHQIPREQKADRRQAAATPSITYNCTFCCPISGTCLAWICTKLEDNCTKDKVDVIFPPLKPHHPWKPGCNGTSASVTTAEMGPCGTAKQQLCSFQICDVLLSWQRFHMQG